VKKATLGWFVGSVIALSFTVTMIRHRAGQAVIPEAVAATEDASSAVVRADGRVVTRPGHQATLSAELSGRVVTVNAVEGQIVKKGDVLAELDRREYDAMLREAVATAGEAFARMKGRRSDLKRSRSLVASGALARTDEDHVREEKGAAEWRLVASNASAARARALLAKTRVIAPIDGVVVSRSIEPAETVAAGTPLFVVADLAARRVEAEVDEFDVGRVHAGDTVEVRADAFPGAMFRGTVEEVPDIVERRKLRPLDPARPTDGAVLLVKASLPSDTPLKLGQRINVTFTSDGRPQ
jgi:RND family efflux transporter MFP subunit